ncbi:MAG: hypothetical protein WCR83_07215 [Candidatus Methanomethylophilaceae archaeon]
MSRIGALLVSPWLQVGRGVAALVSCLLALEAFKMIDVTVISIPEAYLPFMLAAAIVMAIIIGKLVNDTFYHAAVDNKIAEGKIASAAELPQDKRYLFGTVVSMIIAIGVGVYLTPYVIGYIGIIGAGLWTFVAFAGILSAVAVAVFILILHWGLREFLVRASDYAVDLAETVKESAAKVATVKSTVEEVKEIVADKNDEQLP